MSPEAAEARGAVLRLSQKHPLKTPHSSSLYLGRDNTRGRNIAAIPLRGDDERLQAQDVEAMVKACPAYVVASRVVQSEYELEGRRQSGTLLVIDDPPEDLVPLEGLRPGDSRLAEQTIDCLCHVASQWARRPGTAVQALTPGMLYLRGEHVVALPTHAKQGLAVGRRPYLPGSATAEHGLKAGDLEAALCGNIVRVLFALTHHGAIFNDDLARVRGRAARRAWRRLDDCRQLRDVRTGAQRLLTTTAWEPVLLPLGPRPRRRLRPPLLIGLLLLALGGILNWLHPGLWGSLLREGQERWSTAFSQTSRPAAAQPPIAEQQFVILRSTDLGPAATGASGNGQEGSGQGAPFIPTAGQKEQVRRLVAEAAEVGDEQVEFDAATGAWTVRGSQRHLLNILDRLAERANQQGGLAEDLHLSNPLATTLGTLDATTFGGDLSGDGKLLLTFTVESSPGEPNRYRRLLIRDPDGLAHELDLSTDGSTLQFEPLLAEPYQLEAERAEGGVDTYLDVMLCAQREQALRDALSRFLGRAGVGASDELLTTLYESSGASQRFFFLRPQALLRLLRSELSDPRRAAAAREVYQWTAPQP